MSASSTLAPPAPTQDSNGNPEEIQSSGMCIDSHAGAAFFCRQVRRRIADPGRALRILIAGCGEGHEAIAIERALDASVDAVDIEDFVSGSVKTRSTVRFGVASVCDLDFESNVFDAIFYHHVIEHVDDPAASVRELSRTLSPGGWLFVGTPNRHRLFSSIGAHKQSTWEASFFNKFVDNVRDWRDRLTGRFRNEYGAHAGFTRNELDAMLSSHFPVRQWLTDEYLRFKYARGRGALLLPLATHPTICWFAAPSIYVLCQKP